MISARIARLAARFQVHNAINVRSIDIFVQSYPGKPSTNRGIAALSYEVKINNIVTQTGTTGDNGKITVRIPAATTPVLKVMGTEYQIRSSDANFANANTTIGKKERLRCLGYQVGHDGADGNGVDNVDQRYEYERSILDFQADKGLDLDADRASIETDLTTETGG